jgi:hypothetical protein
MLNVSNRVFSRIYQDRIWGNGTELNPLSGSGSSPEVAKPYVDFVAAVIREFEISSVCDVGHGDWSMWRDYKFENVLYFGVDVADTLSTQNNAVYGTSTTQFRQIEPHESLPEAELLLCKEVLQHLSNPDVISFLDKISRFSFLIICNDIRIPNTLDRIRHHLQLRTRLSELCQFSNPFYKSSPVYNNADILTGSYRTIDLESPLFSKLLASFDLVSKFDYSGGSSKTNVHARVLFFKSKSGHADRN